MRRTAAGGSKLFGHKDGMELSCPPGRSYSNILLVNNVAKEKMMAMQGL